MSSDNGHRWSKFWWSDHQGDAALRMCPLAARGLWMEMLCIMHTATPVGHFLINGRAPTDRQMAAIAGCSVRDVQKSWTVMEENGVFSRTSEGIIFCRRMVRDAAASEMGRESVQKRWNGRKNPEPPNTPPNREPTSKPNGEVNGAPTGEAYRPLYRDPSTRSLEAEAEAEPPRGPPVTGGAARRGKSRDAFAALERRLDAAEAERAATIEGTAEDGADFQAFRLRLVGGGGG